MFSGFTVSGASLQVLNVGDRGTISRFTCTDPATLSHLQSLGLAPGSAIAITQRYPNFIISTEDGSLTLPPSLVSAIYLRLASVPQIPQTVQQPKPFWPIDRLMGAWLTLQRPTPTPYSPTLPPIPKE